MSETKSSGLPCMEDEKMICAPSGDQAGVMLVPRKRGKETSFPVSIEYMQICALVRPLDGAKHVDRKSTRLNSSHLVISYAVFCLKKKQNIFLGNRLSGRHPARCAPPDADPD